MHNPKCFGHVLLNRRSPCFGCDLMPECCAARTDNNETIGVLVWPRVQRRPRDEQGRVTEVLVSSVDPKVYPKLQRAFEKLGMHEVKSTRMWKFSRNDVVRVVECRRSHVCLMFPIVPDWRIKMEKLPFVVVEEDDLGSIAEMPSLNTARDLVRTILHGMYQRM